MPDLESFFALDVLVGRTMSGKHQGFLFVILSSFILSVVCVRLPSKDSCDINTCLQHAEAVFSKNSIEEEELFCGRLNKTLRCAKRCLRDFAPFFGDDLVSRQELMEKLCIGDLAYRLTLHWKCILQHAYRLLFCVTTAWSTNELQTGDVKQWRLSRCRKVFAVMECPTSYLLAPCGEESVGVMDEVFYVIFHTILESACRDVTFSEAGYSSETSNDLTNTHLKKTADCFDGQQHLVSECLFNHVYDTSDLGRYFCDRNNSLNFCLQSELSPCLVSTEYEDFFGSILTSLGSYRCEAITDIPATPNREIVSEHSSSPQIIAAAENYSIQGDEDNWRNTMSSTSSMQSHFPEDVLKAEESESFFDLVLKKLNISSSPTESSSEGISSTDEQSSNSAARIWNIVLLSICFVIITAVLI